MKKLNNQQITGKQPLTKNERRKEKKNTPAPPLSSFVRQERGEDAGACFDSLFELFGQWNPSYSRLGFFIGPSYKKVKFFRILCRIL